MKIFDKIQLQFQNNLPFVVYNKPDKKEIIAHFQKNNTLFFTKNYKETGFVFAPFDGNDVVLIPAIHSLILTEEYIFLDIEDKTTLIRTKDLKAKEEYQNLVLKSLDAIENKIFNKVVLSRKEKIDLKNFNLISTIKKLLNYYPSAFTYCFYHPKVGLWLGAFSEKLLHIDKYKFSSMALAGTQKSEISKTVIWQEKEKNEQQFVTDFIVSELDKVVLNIEVSLPYTIKAGNLLHIKTDIKGILNRNSDLKSIIEKLHPTPAVCGFPKNAAKEFIIENENYDREYYAGFLGELNKDFGSNDNKTDLYVNLRCMKIDNNQAFLYIGGGITKDSIPEKEWEETVNKSMTLKQILL